MLGGDTGAPATRRAAPNPFGKVSQLQEDEEEEIQKKSGRNLKKIWKKSCH